MTAHIVLALVWLGLGYETVAYYGQRWPTITHLVRHNREHPAVIAAVAAFIIATAVWAAVHLLVAGRVVDG